MMHLRTFILKTLAVAMLVLGPASAVAVAESAGAQSARGAASSARAASSPALAPAGTSADTRSWTEREYRLGPGDKLRVEVYKQEQLSQSLQVRPDGKITLPLVGDIAAAGRTSLELRDALTTALEEYINNPVVTVIVQAATSAQIYVIGEVVTPGPQIMQGPLTALQALAQGGGLKEFADKGDIHILRKTATGRQAIPFDYKEALKGKTDAIELQPGDTIVVP